MQFNQEISVFDPIVEDAFNGVKKLRNPNVYEVYDKLVQGLELSGYSIPACAGDMLYATKAEHLSDLVVSGVYTRQFQSKVPIGGKYTIEVKVVEYALPHEIFGEYYAYKVFVGDGHGTYLESYK